MTGRVGIACLAMVLAGCARWTGLPEVPATVSAQDAGLAGLDDAAEAARRLEAPLDEAERLGFAATPPSAPIERARWAKDRIARGDAPGGLRALGDVVEAHPADLVIGNAFRMEVFRLHRESLAAARERGARMPTVPAYLAGEPLATLERAAARSRSREIGLQIALAYVDRMVLEPALEIKAPASIDSVRALGTVLAGDPYYVPALVGRGLNYLNRPHRLVWPEHPPPPADAASRDLSLAVAVGKKVGGATPRVRGILLLLLGDAYAHEGKGGVARSWWTLAGESTDDAGVHAGLRERATWPEREMPDRLEARLDERMSDVANPLGDLSFLWDARARGPS